jgi:hypothetical protein
LDVRPIIEFCKKGKIDEKNKFSLHG